MPTEIVVSVYCEGRTFTAPVSLPVPASLIRRIFQFFSPSCTCFHSSTPFSPCKVKQHSVFHTLPIDGRRHRPIICRRRRLDWVRQISSRAGRRSFPVPFSPTTSVRWTSPTPQSVSYTHLRA